MLDGQVVESLLLDYGMSCQLDIDVISTKQSLAMVLHIFFFKAVFIIEKVVNLYFTSMAVLLSRYPICFLT